MGKQLNVQPTCQPTNRPVRALQQRLVEVVLQGIHPAQVALGGRGGGGDEGGGKGVSSGRVQGEGTVYLSPEAARGAVRSASRRPRPQHVRPKPPPSSQQ